MIGELFEFSEVFTPWLQRWRQRTEQDPQSAGERRAMMYRASPAFIPRNHMVEAAIASAEADNDYAPFNQLVDLLGQPHDYQPDLAQYARPPRPDQEVKQTFCGT
jgi:uncharacterized protein YdiU (UPF0061 family)